MSDPWDAILDAPDFLPAPVLADLYVDMTEALDSTRPRPRPTIGRRTDGVALVYPGRDSTIFGDAETGKTLVCGYLVAEVLRDGGAAAWLDLDHNGADAIGKRLLAFGVPAAVLTDRDRFRFASPEDAEQLDAVVADLAGWAPVLVIVDSIGEVVPMYGGSSNSADDYTAVHRRLIKPLNAAGVATVSVDHEAKGVESKAYGASGTTAKRRVVDGTYLRAVSVEAFAPGLGGAVALRLSKDRHGGLREACETGQREPLAAVFRIQPGDPERIDATLHAPASGSATTSTPTDAEVVAGFAPDDRSVRRVRERTGWGQVRATRAIKTVSTQSAQGGVSAYSPKGEEYASTPTEPLLNLDTYSDTPTSTPPMDA